MKVVDGKEIFGIEDVEFDSEPECEHCGVLKPFEPTLDDECTHWCMDCANHQDNFKMSKEEWKAVNVHSQMLQLRYYKECAEELVVHLMKVVRDMTDEESELLVKLAKEK